MESLWILVSVLFTVTKSELIVFDDFQSLMRVNAYVTHSKYTLSGCGPDDQCRTDRAEGPIHNSLSSLPSRTVQALHKYLSSYDQTFMELVYEQNLADRYGLDIMPFIHVLIAYFDTPLSDFYDQLMNSNQTLEVTAGNILGKLRRQLGVSDVKADRFWDAINTLTSYGTEVLKSVLLGHTLPGSCGTVFNPKSLTSVLSLFSSPRVINGLPVLKGEYKFMVSVLYSGRISCSGTIIDSTHILTAAHCIRHTVPESLSVGIAEYDITVPDGEKILRVARISKHPLHNSNQRNDIAVLTLTEPIRGVGNAEPVCLPRGTQCTNLVNRKCKVLGWGASKTDNGKLNFPTIPRDADVNTYDGTKCPYNRPKPNNPRRQLCATGNSDTCNGDSGGPLICLYGGRWIQCGITSYGPRDCNKPGTNGVYTNVRRYQRWIKSVIS